eukprot:2101642-Karenia_brevis.AAC.1
MEAPTLQGLTATLREFTGDDELQPQCAYANERAAAAKLGRKLLAPWAQNLNTDTRSASIEDKIDEELRVKKRKHILHKLGQLSRKRAKLEERAKRQHEAALIKAIKAAKEVPSAGGVFVASPSEVHGAISRHEQQLHTLRLWLQSNTIQDIDFEISDLEKALLQVEQSDIT